MKLVWVFSFGSWYAGEVVKETPRVWTVRYTTGSGATRERAFTKAAPEKVSFSETKPVHFRGRRKEGF